MIALLLRTLDDVGHSLTRDGRDVKVSCADKVRCCLVGTFLGLGLSVLLFLYLPALISDLIDKVYYNIYLKSAVEGVLKILIFT